MPSLKPLLCSRSSIDRVIWSDIHQENPLGTNQPEELYEAVFCSHCLCMCCYACSALNELYTFSKAMKNLVHLAKPGE